MLIIIRMFASPLHHFKYRAFSKIACFLDKFSARNCFCCKKNKSGENKFYCEECYTKLEQKFIYCHKNLAFTLEELEKFCENIIQPSIYKLFAYDEKTKFLMRAFKYRNPHYDKFWANELLKFWTKYHHNLLSDIEPELMTGFGQIDISELELRLFLTAMPMHKNKFKKRGYNQATLIANSFVEKICKLEKKNFLLQSHLGLNYHNCSQIIFVNDLLMRQNDTPSLFDKNKLERLEIMQDAFICKQLDLTDNHLNVLLVIDDIVTTGASFLALDKAIRATGQFDSVIYLALCG
jgi:predicted amidophosphoribosyltransferase